MMIRLRTNASVNVSIGTNNIHLETFFGRKFAMMAFVKRQQPHNLLATSGFLAPPGVVTKFLNSWPMEYILDLYLYI